VETYQTVFSMRFYGLLLTATMLILTAGCRDSAEEPTAPLTMRLTSTSVAGGMIDRAYTCDGQGLSPELSWSNAPPNTRSLALAVTDRDSPFGFNFVHWVVYNIPARMRELPVGLPVQQRLPSGAEQGLGGNDMPGYAPPCPHGKSTHRYDFVLYALDSQVNVHSASKKQLFDAMRGHVIARGDLIARYGR
jgi:Raf kinase inhibitor-like YbhB/YbcL family protein